MERPGDPNPKDTDATIRATSMEATRLAGATPAPAAPSETRERLGPYRLLKRLGGGGMGHIFLAVQESVGRQVALKVLPPGALDGTSVERFQREVQVLGQLQHPNICPVIEAGTSDGTHWYAMEYLRGMDLAKVLRTQRVDTRRAAEIAVQVARALHFAHGRGVIHRDVKPLNVMLARGQKSRGASTTARPGTSLGPLRKWFGMKGPALPVAAAAEAPSSGGDAHEPSPEYEDHAVLIDFGLARDAASKSTRLTVSGEILGTPAYMAPEQARGESASIGPRTDVYALGATLYEMLTLAAPFAGQTPAEVLHKVLYDDPVAPRQLSMFVDRDLETVVQKAMEKDPARRYESAAALADDLERWLAGEPILARRASLAYRIRRRIGRNRLASAGVAAVVLAAALGAWLVFFAPGTLRVDLREPSNARILVDGRPYSGPKVRVWPGAHKVSVEADGYRPQETTLTVGAGEARSLDVRLVYGYGLLHVESDPPGAEVFVDEASFGKTPCEGKALVGARRLRFTLADHASVEQDADVMSGARKDAFCSFVHDTGTLRVTSEPGPAALWLKRIGSAEELRTPSSSVDMKLNTGRWAGVATARNCFSARLAFELRKGETELRHVSPAPMEAWEFRTDGKTKALASADVDGDGIPDILVMTRIPRRVWALSGLTGRLFWMSERPEIPPVDVASLSVADFDGDLKPEACFPDFLGHILVLRAEDGTLQEMLEVGGGREAFRVDDLDGDGLDDLFVSSADSVSAWNVRENRRLWSVPAAAAFGAVATARLRPGRGPDVLLSEQGKGTRALDGRTGEALWTSPVGDRNRPVVFDADGDGLDDALLVTYKTAALVRGTDGAVLKSFQDSFHGRAAGALGDLGKDGRLELVQNADTALSILDASTCEILRKIALPVSWSPPVLVDLNGDGALDIVVASDDRVVGLDGRTSEELWSFEAKARIYDPLLLGDFDGDGRQDVVYADEDGNVTLVRAEPPDLLWKQPNVSWNLEAPVAVGSPPQRLVVPGDERFRILRASDGAVLATGPGSTGTSALAMRVDGADCALLNAKNETRLVDAATGTILWEARPGFNQGNAVAAGADLAGGDGGFRSLDPRTGKERWKSAVNPTVRARSASLGGVFWVPTSGGVSGLRAADGADAGKIPADGNATSVAVVDGDLVFGTYGGKIFRFEPPAKGRAARMVWHAEAGGLLSFGSPAAGGGLVVAVTLDGVVTAFDAATGRTRWSSPLGDEVTGGPSLHDADGDGVPDVAVATTDGLLVVLRGADGSLFWKAGHEGRWGPVVPLWADVDGDGAADLVAQNRSGNVMAWRIRPMRPCVLWPDRSRRTSMEAARLTAAADDERRARAAAEAERDDEVLAAAAPKRSATACALAARVAKRRGDRQQAALFACQARSLGCRLLDIRALGFFLGPPDEGPRDFSWDLLEAPAEELLNPPDDPDIAALWNDAASMLGAAEGREDRALLAIGAYGTWPEITAAFDRFAAAGADRPRLLIARGRLAFRAERDADAVADLRAALPAPEAASELARLAAAGLALRQDGLEAAARGKTAAALALLRRASRLRPGDPGPLNEFAFYGATSKNCAPELARECVDAAGRAVALHKERAPADLGTLAWYLDTLAAAWFAAGDAQKALETQREALALPYPKESEKEMTDRLRKYEDSLKRR